MDHDILVKALDDLELSDGRPATTRRWKELDTMVNALSNDEIRYLQTRLSNFKLQKDICASLPVELLLQVSQDLDLEDILRFRAVSRAWHASFNNVDFCTGLAKDRFPYLSLQTTRQVLGADVGDQNDPSVIINEYILRRVRLLNGKYATRAVHGYENLGQLIDCFSSPQYSNGRFAYQAHPYGITVKCLRTGGTRTYMQDKRMRLQTWCLSNKYLVVGCENHVRPSLQAYGLTSDHHESNAGPLAQLESHTPAVGSSYRASTYTVSLPMVPRWIAGLGDLFGITAHPNKVYLWRVGGALKDLPSPKAKNVELERVVSFTLVTFVPGYTGFAVVRLYRVSDRPTSSLHHIVVDLYENDDVLMTYELAIPVGMSPVRAPQPTVSGNCLTWRLASPNSALIGAVPLSDAEMSTTQVVEFMSFDVIKKSFSFQRYATPRALPCQGSELYAISSYHLWRDRIMFPLIHREDRHVANILENMAVGRPLVIGAAPCEDGHVVSSMHMGIHGWRDVLGSQEPPLAFRTSVKWIWKADAELVEASSHVVTSKSNDTSDRFKILKNMLLGDDNFTILLGLWDGMVVWCHDKSVRPAHAQAALS